MTDLTQAMRNIARALEIHFLKTTKRGSARRASSAPPCGPTSSSMARTAMRPPMSWPCNRCRTSAASTGSAATSPRAEHRPAPSLARLARRTAGAAPRRPDAGGQPPRAQCAVDPAAVRRQPAVASLRFQPRRTGGAGRLLAARSRPRCPRLPHRPGTGAGQSGRLREAGSVRNSSSRSEPQRGNWLKKRQISAGASSSGSLLPRIRGKR